MTCNREIVPCLSTRPHVYVAAWEPNQGDLEPWKRARIWDKADPVFPTTNAQLPHKDSLQSTHNLMYRRWLTPVVQDR
jgi:hypothetical protein